MRPLDDGSNHAGGEVDRWKLPACSEGFVTIMMDTLRDVLRGAWTADVENAWHDGLEAIAATMMRAQQEAASRRAPVSFASRS